jgi:hypothetical protein
VEGVQGAAERGAEVAEGRRWGKRSPVPGQRGTAACCSKTAWASPAAVAAVVSAFDATEHEPAVLAAALPPLVADPLELQLHAPAAGMRTVERGTRQQSPQVELEQREQRDVAERWLEEQSVEDGCEGSSRGRLPWAETGEFATLPEQCGDFSAERKAVMESLMQHPRLRFHHRC